MDGAAVSPIADQHSPDPCPAAASAWDFPTYKGISLVSLSHVEFANVTRQSYGCALNIYGVQRIAWIICRDNGFYDIGLDCRKDHMSVRMCGIQA